jgi:hypothetical protein
MGTVAYAGESNFVPISPLPSLSGGGLATDNDLATYVNNLFEYALIAGAGLAAIYIGIGGFEYIFSEATETKRNGRMRITHALFGLLILLLVTLVLFIINPDIISLRFLNERGSPGSGAAGATGSGVDGIPRVLCPQGNCNGIQISYYGEVGVPGIAGARQTCTTSGGTARDVCLDSQMRTHGQGPKGVCTGGTNKALICIPAGQ